MRNILTDLSKLKIAGEPAMHIVWCVGIILFALILKRPLAHLLTVLLGKIANRFSEKKYATTFKRLLQRPLELVLATILFYIAVNQLTVLLNTTIFDRFNEKGDLKFAVRSIDASDKIFLLFIIIFSTWFLSRLSDFIFHILIDKAFHAARKEREQLLPLIKDVSKILVWVIGVFWILGSVFNVNIPALVTGLGIGGVAIALAAKESVENFFAAFTILAEKPFENGDIIRMDSIEGTVEKVGFRSTKLRTADGSLFVIPNKNLVGNNLENLTERSIRRIKVQVSFQYSNISPAQLESVISLIGKMLNTIPYLIDEKEILLDSFNDNGFVLNVFYRLPQTLPEGLQLLQVKHDINMKIYETVNAFLPNGVQKYQLVTQ